MLRFARWISVLAFAGMALAARSNDVPARTAEANGAPTRTAQANGAPARTAEGNDAPGARSGDASVPVPVELESGVYLLPGARGEPDATNLGRVGNAGFIVGRTGVLVIDTGTSYLHGRALLAAIRTVTDRPVRLAIVTHARQEFLFGAAAFREQGIPLAMQRDAATLMTARCENCLKAMRALHGEAAMRGTAMWKPDIAFGDPLELNVAELIGRPIQLFAFGHSSGPGDLVVYDPRTRTLYAGGLVDAGRIPDLTDADLPGWRDALSTLRALPIETLVPGHGPAGTKRQIVELERYLDQLAARAHALLDANTPLSEVPDKTILPDFAGWELYDTAHRRNAALVYLRYERELLQK